MKGTSKIIAVHASPKSKYDGGYLLLVKYMEWCGGGGGGSDPDSSSSVLEQENCIADMKILGRISIDKKFGDQPILDNSIFQGKSYRISIYTKAIIRNPCRNRIPKRIRPMVNMAILEMRHA